MLEIVNRRIFPLLCLFLLNCGHLPQSDPVHLQYKVRLVDPIHQIFDVELLIKNADAGDLILNSYVFQEYASVKKFKAMHNDHVKIKIEEKKKKERQRKQWFTKLSQIIKNPQKGDIRVFYQIQVQTNTGMHGKEYFNDFGYIGETFALISGRHLFLLPNDPITTAKIQFSLPDNWTVAIPWEVQEGWYVPCVASSILKEELANTAIGLGLLEMHKKRVGNTDVEVYVFENWKKKTKTLIVNTAFSIYQRVVDVFGGDAGGKYTFSFVPKSNKGKAIHTRSWSSSQGLDMDVPNSERWLMCLEQLIDRWVKFPPSAMVYHSQEDFWLVDGLRRFYAIEIGGQAGLVDRKRYLDIEKVRFISRFANKGRQDVLSPITQSSLPVLTQVRELYTDNSRTLKIRREHIAPTIVAFLDKKIRTSTGGELKLSDIIRYQYGKKQKGLHLQSDMREILGVELTKHLAQYLYDFGKIADKIGAIQPKSSLPIWKLKKTQTTSIDTLRIMMTGNTQGFLEHCGCKVSQEGGIARRATVIKDIREKFPETLLIDVGGFFPFKSNIYDLTNQDIEELNVFAKSMNYMSYDLATISFPELYYGYSQFHSSTETLGFPIVCANIKREGKLVALPHTSVSVGKYKIGFLGIYQHPITRYSKNYEYYLQDRTSDLEFLDPLDTINQYLPELNKENDLVIVIGYLEPELINEIVSIEGLDIIISWGNNETRLFRDQGLVVSKFDLSGFKEDALVIYSPKEAGLYALSLQEFYINQTNKVIGTQLKMTALSSDIIDDKIVRSMIDSIYIESRSAKVEPLRKWDEHFTESKFEHLGESAYVSVESCKSCHPDQYTQWQSSSHAFAINTLLDVRRQNNPKCIVCHVTGVGHATGYKIGDLKHPMLNVQCEACHGPGGKHIGNPIQFEMVRQPPARLCITCHDEEHSDFNFSTYYEKVKH